MFDEDEVARGAELVGGMGRRGGHGRWLTIGERGGLWKMQAVGGRPIGVPRLARASRRMSVKGEYRAKNGVTRAVSEPSIDQHCGA